LQEELAQRLATILPKLDRAVRSGDAETLFWLQAHVRTSTQDGRESAVSDAPCGAAPQVGQLYFCAFMRTMQREWHGIDRLRLDKFLVLVRCFVRALFGHLRSSGWCASPSSVWHTQCGREVEVMCAVCKSAGLLCGPDMQHGLPGRWGKLEYDLTW